MTRPRKTARAIAQRRSNAAAMTALTGLVAIGVLLLSGVLPTTWQPSPVGTVVQNFAPGVGTSGPALNTKP